MFTNQSIWKLIKSNYNSWKIRYSFKIQLMKPSTKSLTFKIQIYTLKREICLTIGYKYVYLLRDLLSPLIVSTWYRHLFLSTPCIQNGNCTRLQYWIPCTRSQVPSLYTLLKAKINSHDKQMAGINKNYLDRYQRPRV